MGLNSHSFCGGIRNTLILYTLSLTPAMRSRLLTVEEIRKRRTRICLPTMLHIVPYQSYIRLLLVVLSAFAYGSTFSPKHGDTKANPILKSIPRWDAPFPRKREWLIVWAGVYVLPLLKMAYYIAAACDCLSVLCSQYPAFQELARHISPTVATKYVVTVSYDSYPAPILSLLALATAIFGGLLRVSCYQMFRGKFSWELGPTKNPGLITSGPYGFVRHPSYSAVWICYFGLLSYHVLLPGSWVRGSGILNLSVARALIAFWFFALGGELFLVTMRVGEEDELMRKQFGKEWEIWRQRVRFRLIPGLY
ncbi:hypothetical protein E1B28_010673 [Marasmius oreades]|uniref:Protein-S-isoprenylcysteine O-methyltransferase n=1 Tax=Marasmius oreades TaxID=181124 RepID=A0A9P7URD3_9AGAR|nr:uncharacterized protein E1B28_010673 [Marasmius oreades]KAG7091652.1 hypothetical protein E1B28_010673 [Marasmius oreades]